MRYAFYIVSGLNFVGVGLDIDCGSYVLAGISLLMAVLCFYMAEIHPV